jgi:hypothetical protein
MTKRSSSKDGKVDLSTSSTPVRLEENKQTSPVTIGGGSVSIDFDHGDYIKTDGVFVKTNDEIDTVWVYDAEKSLKWDLLRFVKNKDCVVTVHTRIDSSTADIVIKSKPQGPLSIEFDDTGEFPLDTGHVRRHSNARRQIVNAIEVFDNKDQSTATFSVPSEGNCSIIIVNRF